MLQQTEFHSPLGKLILLADDKALHGVWFQDQTYFGAGYNLDAIPKGNNAILGQSKDWLQSYFAGENPQPHVLPLKPEVTVYRQQILDLLLEIPYRQTRSYLDLAMAFERKNGRPTSPRAIGGAVGHNPISLIIPCHRILGHDGSLTGYAGGIERKIWLLEHENPQ
ncbi:methylated-DNA--[protein]-cysteine S-methyltransferase [Streptococcus sp. 121]|uniref:methylated-DNA--[protein]-cysteine S-methyltransferase n=1 Tax=Streptococcus sp. 121 TaxID=2797637 RepID=UPI0018F0C83E|nr:methylated-DNA--[protein]-cysteine S-methyltransferase [Streptococcus sp. 121]MBJ6746322.1 methylated-DNA--[protein]-cysteine S-methyltransferase [Streptococcus sp. 121]